MRRAESCSPGGYSPGGCSPSGSSPGGSSPSGSRQKSETKVVKLEDAVGSALAHDITEIVPGEYKGPRFRKGQIIEQKDLCRLMRLGKRHLYVLDLEEGQIHEDDAALKLAESLAGPGVTFSGEPREGKIGLVAAYDGLFKVNVNALTEFNLVPDVMCASIHTNTPVKRGQVLAGTRAIPLVIDEDELDRAADIAEKNHPIFSVGVFNPLKTGLIITGNEVYEGVIEDRFQSVVGGKLESFGASLVDTAILPDDDRLIGEKVASFLSRGMELIITTGGMSVDPDDVTRQGIRKAGIDRFHYSAAVLPGAMFMLAYHGDTPIVGIPACALYHKITVFDLILPRLLAGEKPDNTDLARFAHGGLCLNCPTCRFPDCPFGKT